MNQGIYPLFAALAVLMLICTVIAPLARQGKHQKVVVQSVRGVAILSALLGVAGAIGGVVNADDRNFHAALFFAGSSVSYTLNALLQLIELAYKDR